MDRCRGKTKSGERCKRAPRQGTQYCSTHAGQAEAPKEPKPQAERQSRPAGESVERDVLDAVFGMAAAGVVIVSALVLRRWIRIL